MNIWKHMNSYLRNKCKMQKAYIQSILLKKEGLLRKNKIQKD